MARYRTVPNHGVAAIGIWIWIERVVGMRLARFMRYNFQKQSARTKLSQIAEFIAMNRLFEPVSKQAGVKTTAGRKRNRGLTQWATI
jgi:hypothetical protein